MLKFIVFIICFSFINQAISDNFITQAKEAPEETSNSNPSLGGTFFRLFGKFLAKNVVRLVQFFLQAAAADPVVVEIGYGETVSFEVGLINLETGEFEEFPIEKPLFNSRSLTFAVTDYPGGNDQSTWTVQFNPYTVIVEKGTLLKTNVSLSLRSPPILSNAIQSGILKLTIYDTWANGDLWHPPKGSSWDNFIGRLIWFYGAIGSYGPYSGVTEVYELNVEILVKVKPYHAVYIESVPYINFKPDEIASIPIIIQNEGNYNDTISFRVVSDKDVIKISDPISITLAPGEIKNTYLGVSSPPNLFDYGTIHKIKIEAYSIDQPNVTIAERTIHLETRGLYVSEIGILGILLMIIIVFFILGLFIYRHRLFIGQHCVKPEKPWNIPAEKKYLEKLKEKNSDKYIEIWNMMQDEYNSALLWYKYYCESITKPKQIKKEKIKKKKIKVKKQKGEIIEKVKKPLEKVKPEEPKITKKELLVDMAAEAEKRRRERALLRIRRDQEKQRKKM